MKAKIVAELVKARDLQPGDLFSTAGAGYWDHWNERHSIGECVYIRTNISADNAPDADEEIYRITIEREKPAGELVRSCANSSTV